MTLFVDFCGYSEDITKRENISIAKKYADYSQPLIILGSKKKHFNCFLMLHQQNEAIFSPPASQLNTSNTVSAYGADVILYCAVPEW